MLGQPQSGSPESIQDLPKRKDPKAEMADAGDGPLISMTVL
jgi:hypothetical protein